MKLSLGDSILVGLCIWIILVCFWIKFFEVGVKADEMDEKFLKDRNAKQ